MSGSPAPGRAFVLGGGIAGMVAAFGLAERGYRVSLLESRRHCGGRAFSFVDRHSGRRLDNGPHAMLGCYAAMLRLLARLGTAGLFTVDPALTMAYRLPDGRGDRLRLSTWPVPLAMPFALLRLRLPWFARLRALLGMAGVVLGAPASWTLADWLRRWRQQGTPDAWLWRPLCRAIMNVEPEDCAATDFLATLREAFLGSASRAAFLLPRRPWGEILADPAPAALLRAGVELRFGARVVGLPAVAERIHAIELGSGECLPVAPGDLVVSALPWHAFATVLPGSVPAPARLRSSPIVTAHFHLTAAAAAPADEGPVVALVDGDPFHFLLRTPGEPANSFALLAGGNRQLDGLSVAAIEALARQQLARCYPGFAATAPGQVRIAKENLATFVAAPGSAAGRPQPGRWPTGLTNLWLCGDWTAIGLPATLEGAARSAELMLARLDGQAQ